MIGLGVMGRNLALNLASKGRVVAAFDRTAAALAALAGAAGIMPFSEPAAVVQALTLPRALMLMVPAGRSVDEAIAAVAPHLAAGDILIDGGNSHFRDTIRRARELAGRGIAYLGFGVSGGEAGARLGPSIMAGGPDAAWRHVAPHFMAIAAQHNGEPCCAWFGGDGAGHFVKMIHNGIEYAEMQAIAEIYVVLRDLLGQPPAAIAEVFAGWNRGELASYLVEITADILKRRDGANGPPLIDLIADRARQKGTGQWASVAALELGAPAPSLAEAVAARHVSAASADRERIAGALGAPQRPWSGGDLTADLAAALLGARIAIYAQGFRVLDAARREFGWPELSLAEVARVWQGGCIIRARLLDDIRAGFAVDPSATDLLQLPALRARLRQVDAGWRRTLTAAIAQGAAVPVLASALAWTDGMRTRRSGANLIQAQRDYFGAHGVERLDRPGEHRIDWSAGS
jgi:6-phosphogluconate dehydrogenase